MSIFEETSVGKKGEILPKKNIRDKMNLHPGDRVIIKSPAGEARVRVAFFEGAMPEFVYMPLGLGHTAYDEFSQGKGANPNDIILAQADPLSGHPVWWNTPVKLIKV